MATRDELLSSIETLLEQLKLKHLFERFGDTISFYDQGFIVIMTKKGLRVFHQDLVNRLEQVRHEEVKTPEEPISPKGEENKSWADKMRDLGDGPAIVPIAPELLLARRQEKQRYTIPQRRRVIDEDELLETETIEYDGDVCDDFISDIEDVWFGSPIDESWED